MAKPRCAINVEGPGSESNWQRVPFTAIAENYDLGGAAAPQGKQPRTTARIVLRIPTRSNKNPSFGEKEKVFKSRSSCAVVRLGEIANRQEIENFHTKTLHLRIQRNTLASLGENQWLISMEPQQVHSDQAQCLPADWPKRDRIPQPDAAHACGAPRENGAPVNQHGISMPAAFGLPGFCSQVPTM